MEEEISNRIEVERLNKVNPNVVTFGSLPWGVPFANGDGSGFYVKCSKYGAYTMSGQTFEFGLTKHVLEIHDAKVTYTV